MTSDSEQSSESEPQNLNWILILSLVGFLLALRGFLAWQGFQGRFQMGLTGQQERLTVEALVELTLSNPKMLTPTLKLTASSTPSPTARKPDAVVQPLPLPGTVFLSIDEGGFTHLFAFLPRKLNFVRLTSGDWRDISPALSPDGKNLAFASNRNGVWDLYVMHLETGQVSQLTNTPEYEGAPTWSPDGLWLAYEAYVPDEEGGNLDLFIRPLDDSQAAIRLTDDPATDFSPSWAPEGRKIAFVSTRTGEKEIWLADLDQIQDRFSNISQSGSSAETSPVWSPDGSRLTWSENSLEGVGMLAVKETSHPEDRAKTLGQGSLSAWDPSGEAIMAVIQTPNKAFLSGYRFENGAPIFPFLIPVGSINGISWGSMDEQVLSTFSNGEAAKATLPPLWIPRYQDGASNQETRLAIVPLPGVQAPLAMLQDGADEAFLAFRVRAAKEAGWDLLGVLEQAYVPLTSPLEPGYLEDWLYTGRAFKLNLAPLSAGWLKIVREDFGAQTYWRVFVKTRFQDGSQGAPLKELPWDLEARFSGEARSFEQGGAQEDSVPEGYWVDLTALAAQFGWERVPSLSSWRIAYSSVRANELVLREGLDWFSAMLEIYPRSALNTPTRVSSPTPTPTFTETPTPSATLSSTRYLTRTPTGTLARQPTATRTPTRTPTRKP